MSGVYEYRVRERSGQWYVVQKYRQFETEIGTLAYRGTNEAMPFGSLDEATGYIEAIESGLYAPHWAEVPAYPPTEEIAA